MPKVGVRELKARLSHYLRAVKRGEVVVVTERNQVIAELKAPPAHDTVPVEAREALATLVASGEVTRAVAEKRRWRWSVAGLGLSPEVVTRLLDELRADTSL
jgi:antitoxin (DNA-binding transcriptional repressor) of toxin-antitoxin stability system